MTTLTTYPLRLPKSVKAAAEVLSKADGTSLNQFVATAVAEKIACCRRPKTEPLVRVVPTQN